MPKWTAETRQRVAWWGLIGVVGVVYARAVGYGAIPSWDDALFILDRQTVQRWWSVSWYRRVATPEVGYAMPLPTFVWAHVRMAVGESLFPHVLHGLNVAIHIVNIMLVGWLVGRWSRPELGWVVAAVWGLHPVCVESVAWLTNLKTVMAAMGVLGALAMHERALRSSGIGCRVGAVALFAAALGCRPDAAVFVPIAAIRSLWRRGWREAVRRDGGWLVGMGVVAVAWVLFSKVGHDAIIEYSAVAPGTQSMPIRMARAMELSVRHLVVPFDLHPGYFRDPSAGVLRAIPGCVIGLGIAALMVGSHVVRWHQITAGLAVFLVWYTPFSGIVFLPRFTADTYLYGPAIGFAFAVVAAIDRWWRARRPASSSIRTGIVVAVVAVLATWSARQVGRWQNARTLWGPVLEEEPRVARPYEQVAWYHARQQNWEAGVEVANKGLSVFRASKNYPYFVAAMFDDAGEVKRAASLAVEAVLEDANPKDLHYKVLLDIFARREMSPPPAGSEAREALNRAIEMYPTHDEWMSRRTDRMHIADYVTKYLTPELAAPFIRREFDAEQPHCFAWIVADRIAGGRSAGGIDAPPLPSRCEEAVSGGQR